MKLIFESHRKGLNINDKSLFSGDQRNILESLMVVGDKAPLEDGLLIYECEPSLRTLFVPRKIRINLPYLYFVVRYLKDSRAFFYPGVLGSGLHLYASMVKISSFQDEICVFPTDIDGQVCLDHRYDYRKFPSKESLASDIIAAWFGTSQTDQAWKYHKENGDISRSQPNYCYSWKDYPFITDWSNKLLRNQFCYRSSSRIIENRFGDSLAREKFYGRKNQIAPHILADGRFHQLRIS